MITDY